MSRDDSCVPLPMSEKLTFLPASWSIEVMPLSARTIRCISSLKSFAM